MTTIHEAVAAARQRLRRAGIPPDEADLDARVLAEHALGWDAARLLADGDRAAPRGFSVRFRSLMARRVAREPVSYIIGRHEFWNLDFEVSPAVLIPRPETELIVEIALKIVAPAASFAVADVCTGSGCLAVAIAHERPSVAVTAGDVSEAALAVARRNAARHRVDSRVRFVHADVLDGMAGRFDLIVANPPYVPEADRSTLQREVRDHEPPLALFAGPDGLDLIRRLVAQAPERLADSGTLVFEIGFGQAVAVERLISAAAGLKMIEIRRDLQGIPRTVIARSERSAHAPGTAAR